MRGPLLWAGGLVGSLAAHGVAFAFLNLSIEPDPTPTQPKPETKLSMEAYQVDRQEAREQQADSETAPEAESEATELSQGAIAQSRAQAQQPDVDQLTDAVAPTETLDAEPPKTATISGSNPAQNRIRPSTQAAQAITQIATPSAKTTAQRPRSNQITASVSPAVTIASLAAPQTTVQQVVLQQETTTPSRPNIQPTQSKAPDATTADEATPDTDNAPAVQAPSDTAQAARPDVAPADTADPNPQIAATIDAPAEQTASQKPDAPAADQPPLPAQFAKASLAWNFGDRVVTDPAAIATIQAFMAPQEIDGSKQVRDGLSDLLTSVDCARLSATFIPETGALELRGHVPDNTLRAPILQALQAQIGDGITVTDNLLHLPKPQCGALTGIADVGLPQSTDQLTNKRLIGDNAQAVEYTYSEGQPLAFDLTAPDYDAVVYVDYFDAAGQVIHLVPNEIVPLTAYRAKEVVGIERGDGPRLNITIGPPFGQEIAVAFAASRPLFSETRPIIEPAEPYLEFLKARVAEAREAGPDFKGEWVYFFITTQPATQ